MAQEQTSRWACATDFLSGFFLGNWLNELAAFLVLVVLLSAVWGTLNPSYDPIKMELGQRLQPPSRAHPFGTDEFGRDVFSILFIRILGQ